MGCITEGGPSSNQKCVFPFRHDGIVYNECTTAGLGQPWCSVATYINGTHINGQGLYGLCPKTCPGGNSKCRPGSKWQQDCNTCECSLLSTPICTEKWCGGGVNQRCRVDEGPALGEECVFPFKWGGKLFTECAPWNYGGDHQGKLWCSTKTDRFGERSKLAQDETINQPDVSSVVFKKDDNE